MVVMETKIVTTAKEAAMKAITMEDVEAFGGGSEGSFGGGRSTSDFANNNHSSSFGPMKEVGTQGKKL